MGSKRYSKGVIYSVKKANKKFNILESEVICFPSGRIEVGELKEHTTIGTIEANDIESILLNNKVLIHSSV